MLTLLLSSAPLAATYSVGSTGDYTTISDAVADTGSESVLTLNLLSDYAVGGEPGGGGLEIGRDLVLRSADGALVRIPPIRAVDAAKVTLEQVSILTVPYSVYNPQSGVSIEGPYCALQVLEESVVSGVDVVITPEVSSTDQGGVCVKDADLDLSGGLVQVNYLGSASAWGPAGWSIALIEGPLAYAGSVILEDVTLEVGPQGEGGGVYVSGSTNTQTLQVTGGSFTRFGGTNQAGSAIRANALVSTQVTGSTFTQNSGTAVSLDGDFHVLTDVDMSGSEGVRGGDLVLNGGQLSVLGGRFVDSYAQNSGGVLFSYPSAGQVTFADVRVEGAKAGAQAALMGGGASQVTLHRCGRAR